MLRNIYNWPETLPCSYRIFWLIDGISDADKAKFLEEVNKLSQIQSVEEFYCGKPAATPSREVVDESYDFGLNCCA